MDNNSVPEAYSVDDELYKTFGRSFVSALHEGIQIGMGKKQGSPARELVDELKKYVEEERAREHQ